MHLEQLAAAVQYYAAAINASRHLNRTEETICVNDMLEKTYEMFWKIDHYTESNLRHRELRRSNGPSMEERPTDLDLDKAIELNRKACRRAMYASSLLMSALITRSEVVRATFLDKKFDYDSQGFGLGKWG